jgi:hypothetical protein
LAVSAILAIRDPFIRSMRLLIINISCRPKKSLDHLIQAKKQQERERFELQQITD